MIRLGAQVSAPETPTRLENGDPSDNTVHSSKATVSLHPQRHRPHASVWQCEFSPQPAESGLLPGTEQGLLAGHHLGP